MGAPYCIRVMSKCVRRACKHPAHLTQQHILLPPVLYTAGLQKCCCNATGFTQATSKVQHTVRMQPAELCLRGHRSAGRPMSCRIQTCSCSRAPPVMMLSGRDARRARRHPVHIWTACHRPRQPPVWCHWSSQSRCTSLWEGLPESPNLQGWRPGTGVASVGRPCVWTRSVVKESSNKIHTYAAQQTNQNKHV
jgi:hypothetical protein